MSKQWVDFLKESGICHEDSMGNMPCDNGAICDRCMSPEVEKQYETWKKNKGKRYIVSYQIIKDDMILDFKEEFSSLSKAQSFFNEKAGSFKYSKVSINEV